MEDDQGSSSNQDETKYGPVDIDPTDRVQVTDIVITDKAISKTKRDSNPAAHRANDRAYDSTELRRLVRERRGKLYQAKQSNTYHLLTPDHRILVLDLDREAGELVVVTQMHRHDFRHDRDGDFRYIKQPHWELEE